MTLAGVPSYIHPENINSIDPERIADIESYLSKTPYGEELLKLFEETGVIIEFGDISDPNTLATTSPDGKRITLDIDFANLSDAELAAFLVYEGTHLKQIASNGAVIPGLGLVVTTPEFLITAYGHMIYPWDMEYDSYRAEAEFWKSIGADLPESKILSGVEEMIFTPDGDYRDFKDACWFIHDSYTHLFDPQGK